MFDHACFPIYLGFVHSAYTRNSVNFFQTETPISMQL